MFIYNNHSIVMFHAIENINVSSVDDTGYIHVHTKSGCTHIFQFEANEFTTAAVQRDILQALINNSPIDFL